MFGWHFPCCIDQPGGRLQHTPHGDAECKAIAATMALLRWQVTRCALDLAVGLSMHPMRTDTSSVAGLRICLKLDGVQLRHYGWVVAERCQNEATHCEIFTCVNQIRVHVVVARASKEHRPPLWHLPSSGMAVDVHSPGMGMGHRVASMAGT